MPNCIVFWTSFVRIRHEPLNLYGHAILLVVIHSGLDTHVGDVDQNILSALVDIDNACEYDGFGHSTEGACVLLAYEIPLFATSSYMTSFDFASALLF